MIKAAGKRLVVRELEEPEEIKNGLILPNKKKEQVRAEVISMGTEVDNMISLHDIVYLMPEHGIPILINGQPYLSIVENQVLAAFDDK